MWAAELQAMLILLLAASTIPSEQTLGMRGELQHPSCGLESYV